MKILALYDQSGPGYHRVLLPVHLLNLRFGHEVVVKYKFTEDDVKDIDIIFFNRLAKTVDLPTLINWREKYGFKMICDMDDHWLLGSDHILYNNYKRYGLSEIIADHVKAADYVTVTHDRLASEVIHHFQKSVCVLPNAIPRIDQFDIEKYPFDEVRLFWAGGVTHRKDLELLKRPLELIKSKFIIAGYVKGDQEWEGIARMFKNTTTTAIESMGVHEYYKVYSQCDIALIPLRETVFNTHKSNLKILEAANIGSPVVVSRVHPYLDFPEDVVNYVDMHDPWYKQINKLLKDPLLRAEQGQALKEYCDQYFNFESINETRKQLFEHVISKHEAIQHRPAGILS